MALMTGINMVDGIKERGLDLSGMSVSIKLDNTGNTVHRATVMDVYPGKNIPSVTVVFEGASPFRGQRMEISGDSHNNLIASNITHLRVNEPGDIHA